MTPRGKLKLFTVIMFVGGVGAVVIGALYLSRGDRYNGFLGIVSGAVMVACGLGITYALVT